MSNIQIAETVRQRKTGIATQIIGHTAWLKKRAKDNMWIAKVYYWTMSFSTLALFFAIWLEPNRGTIGILFRIDPALLFIVSQMLFAGIIIFGLAATRQVINSFLWFVGNSGLIFLAVMPFLHNIWITVFCNMESCPRPTSWASVIFLLMFAFFLIIITATIDPGNETQIRQEAVQDLSLAYIKLDTDSEETEANEKHQTQLRPAV